MFIVGIIILLLIALGISFNNNNSFLSKEQTTTINGVFVLLVFNRHFIEYIKNVPYLFSADKYFFMIDSRLGQLIVTTFLFFSGYAVSLSLKKPHYLDNFFTNKIVKLFLRFGTCIVLFIITNAILGKEYPLYKVLGAFTGWYSIGNSNWYYFAIIYTYFSILISYNVFKNKPLSSIACMFFLTLVYIFICKENKDNHWFNTIIVFPVGMLFEYYFSNIQSELKNNYYELLIICVCFLLLCYRGKGNVFSYMMLSVIFALTATLISYKVCFKSKVFLFLGNHVFEMYLLQRLSFNMLIGLKQINVLLYYFVSLFITILASIIYKKAFSIIDKLITK